MNRSTPSFSISTHLAALAIAAGLTAAQLGAVNVLAQWRSVSEHATVVKLDRVVVKAQRVRAQAAVDDTSACATASHTVC